MIKSEYINELALALSKAQGEINPAIKESENPYFRSKYADIRSIWEAIKIPMCKNGLSISQIISVENDKNYVETMLMHSSGQWLLSKVLILPVKNDPQSSGGAITYARRYSLQAIFCLPTEDDDGEVAMGRGPEKIKNISIKKQGNEIIQEIVDSKKEKPEAKIQATLINENQPIIDEILQQLKRICNNKTKKEKEDFLKKEMGIDNFNEIYGFNKDSLVDCLNFLKGIKEV